MKTTQRRSMGSWGLLLLVVAVGLVAQGCFPYTSKYKPDPSLTTVRAVVAPDAPGVRASRLEIKGIPSIDQPDLSVRAVRTVTGPGIEITSITEQRYKNAWSPAIIPIGLLGIAEIPIFVIVGLFEDPHKERGMFSGWDPRGCEPKGMIAAAFPLAIGHMPTCEKVGEPRVTESSSPLGRDVTEESPFPGAKLSVSLAETGGTAKTKGRILETDKNGMATVPVTSLLLALPDAVQDVEAVALLEENPTVSVRAPIPPSVVQALLRPARAEREGDRATAAGKGLIALEHYTQAAEMSTGSGVNRELRKKIAATYRALPVKPTVPEETRRLLVQAEALAKTDNAAGAIEKLSEAIRSAPWLPVARYNLAYAQAMNSDYAAAIDSMNIYLELAPDAPDARQARDKVYEWETLKAASPSPNGSRRNRVAPTR